MGANGTKPKRKIPPPLSPPPLSSPPLSPLPLSPQPLSPLSLSPPTRPYISEPPPLPVSEKTEDDYNRRTRSEKSLRFESSESILEPVSFEHYYPNKTSNDSYSYGKYTDEIEYVPLYNEYSTYKRHLMPRCACSRPSSCIVTRPKYKQIRRIYCIKPTATIED